MAVGDTCSAELSGGSYSYYDAGVKYDNDSVNGTLNFVCTYSNSSIKYLLAINSFSRLVALVNLHRSWNANVTYMNASRMYEASVPSKSDLKTYTTTTTRSRNKIYWTNTGSGRDFYVVDTDGSFDDKEDYNDENGYIIPAIKITF